MSDDLTALAVLCMASKGADRQLDASIHEAVTSFPARLGGVGWADGVLVVPAFPGWSELPFYTASLDVAMTLVPDNMGASVSRHGKRNDDCSAYVGKSDSDARGNYMTDTSTADAKTMALAVCAAALKARHKLLNPATTKSRKKSVRNAKAGAA